MNGYPRSQQAYSQPGPWSQRSNYPSPYSTHQSYDPRRNHSIGRNGVGTQPWNSHAYPKPHFQRNYDNGYNDAEEDEDDDDDDEGDDDEGYTSARDNNRLTPSRDRARSPPDYTSRYSPYSTRYRDDDDDGYFSGPDNKYIEPSRGIQRSRSASPSRPHAHSNQFENYNPYANQHGSAYPSYQNSATGNPYRSLDPYQRSQGARRDGNYHPNSYDEEDEEDEEDEDEEDEEEFEEDEEDDA
ncbi:MAG: hypothetical protein Q9228_007958, partial [Teloschistes exilis]